MSLFLPGSFADKYYTLTRDCQHRSDFKNYIELAWEQYEPFCGDLDFQTQASLDFNGASWNLFVAKTLIDLGFDLQKSEPAGPDIRINHEGKTIWLECIAVNNGTGRDAVPVSPMGQGYSPAEEKIILRHTSGLREKLQKHAQWVASGIVSPEDIYIVCLNAGAVDEAAWVDHPLITYLERSVFSFGPEQTHISIETGEVTGHSFAHRPAIFKQNQNAVGTDLFFSADSGPIAGVFYLNKSVFSVYDRNGKDIHFLHNPQATSPLPQGLIEIGVEKWKEDEQLVPKWWSDYGE